MVDKKKPSKKVTLRDVAERANVHLSTVSRVLSPSHRKMVSDDVAKRVREIANDMGYRANPFAYGLRTNKSRTIGVVIPDLTNPIFPPIIRGIEHALRKDDYTAIFADSNENVDEEELIVERMRDRQIEGLILATAHRAGQIVDRLAEENVPVVLINRAADNGRVLSVTNDDYRGAQLAVDHLLNLGHRRIAHLAGPQYLSTGFDRREGYLAALKRRNISVDKKLIIACETFSIDQGVTAFEELLKRDVPFDAIFAANDTLALGCYRVLRERGISCPETISIAGYNNMPFIDMVNPPLTTVRFVKYQMGVEAANMLLRLLDEADEPPLPIILEPELLVRESTRPPSSA